MKNVMKIFAGMALVVLMFQAGATQLIDLAVKYISNPNKDNFRIVFEKAKTSDTNDVKDTLQYLTRFSGVTGNWKTIEDMKNLLTAIVSGDDDLSDLVDKYETLLKRSVDDYINIPNKYTLDIVIKNAKTSDTNDVKDLLKHLNRLSGGTGNLKFIQAMQNLLTNEIESRNIDDSFGKNVIKEAAKSSDLVDKYETPLNDSVEDYISNPNGNNLDMVVENVKTSDTNDVKYLLESLNSRLSGVTGDLKKAIEKMHKVLTSEIALRGADILGKNVTEIDVEKPLSDAVLKYIQSKPEDRPFLMKLIEAIVGGSEAEDIKFALEDAEKLSIKSDKDMKEARKIVTTYLKNLPK